MKNYDQSVEISHNPNWPYIPDHPYRILIISGSGSGKTNVILNLIKNQRLINDLSTYHQLLIYGREKAGIEILKYPEEFIDYLLTIDDVYENLEDYNPTKKRRMFRVFDNMITGMKSNKKLSPIVTELFLRGRELNISPVFISQSYFNLISPKAIRLNGTHYFIMKIPNKREFQQIASNHSSDIDFEDFMRLDKDYTKEPYSFLLNDATLSLDNSSRFRKNLL